MKRIVYILAVACAWSFSCGAATNTTVAARGASAPLVVMKQAQIRGQVFLMTEEEDGGTRGAPDVSIVVRDPERAGNVVETQTKNDGSFILPDLEVGEYQLIVATLNLRLRVENPEKSEDARLYIAKMLVVFLPAEMAR